MTAGDTYQLLVEFDVQDGDRDELDQVTARLRSELLKLDVEAVDRPRAGPAPEGTRSVELAAVGALILTVKEGQELIASVIHRLRTWVSHDAGRSVKLTIDGDSIELSSVSDEDQQRLIEDWLARRSRRPE